MSTVPQNYESIAALDFNSSPYEKILIMNQHNIAKKQSVVNLFVNHFTQTGLVTNSLNCC